MGVGFWGAVAGRSGIVCGCFLALLATLAGCAERPEEGASASRKVVFITNGDSPFWDAAEKGFLDAAAKQGLTGQFLRNKGGDSASQLRLLDQIASRTDVAGLAISIVDASAVGIIDRLREIGARIPVVTVDSDCRPEDQSCRRAYIGTNNLEAGKVAGRIAKQLAPDGGGWIGFVGSADADNARGRIEGFIANAGDGFQEVDLFQDQHDAGKARENVRAALTKDAAVLFGIYSYNAPAIAEVVQDAGLRSKFKIVTFDAEENTMRAIDQGLIDATIVQNTFDMGSQAVTLLNAFANKDEAKVHELLGDSTELDTKVRVVVPNDSTLEDESVQKIKDFQAYMESMGLRST